MPNRAAILRELNEGRRSLDSAAQALHVSPEEARSLVTL